MWRNVLATLGTLLFVLLLGVLCTLGHRPRIEAEIAERATLALTGAGLDGISAAAREGRDVVLLGRVDTAATKERAIATVSEVWGVRRVVSRLTVRLTLDPGLLDQGREDPSSRGGEPEK